MTIGELRELLNNPNFKGDEEIHMSVCFKNPYDEESTQDWFAIKLIDDIYRNPTTLSFEFKAIPDQYTLFKAFSEYVDNHY